MLEDGEMNPEKQDSFPLTKEKSPVIRRKWPTKRLEGKKRTKVKVQMLSESSNLEVRKAKDPEKYKPPNWPEKRYVTAINDLPKYWQYWLDNQKKITKTNRRRQHHIVQSRTKPKQDLEILKTPVLITKKEEINSKPVALKSILKKTYTPDNVVPLKGSRCAGCSKNQYHPNAKVAVRRDYSLQGNLHNIPYTATVSENRYSNESVAGFAAPGSLYLKSFELSGRSARVLSLYPFNESTAVRQKMPQRTNKYQRTKRVAG
ncbi:MAG: hypothetical protein GY858_06370, partial [Candidatus Omnitrophica bacterium]|nr:hypothetical protein [Candidatus Omnitrophota bacterium]